MVIPKLQTTSHKMKEISTPYTVLSLHPVFCFHYSESGMLSETSSSPQLTEFKNVCNVLGCKKILTIRHQVLQFSTPYCVNEIKLFFIYCCKKPFFS